MFWFNNHRESFLEASPKEKEETIQKLIEQGTMRSGYYFLLILATFIVVPGLFLNNVSVLIGGMILAPLMVPLLSLSLSLVAGSSLGIIRSLKILGISVALVLIVSAIMTLVLKSMYVGITWFPAVISPGIYIFIAFCSGLAGAFAWVKENLAPAVAGVATAVSLLPPLCAAGIGLALFDFMLLKNSLIMFTANLLGIILAGFLVFWILGFLNSGNIEKKILEKNT